MQNKFGDLCKKQILGNTYADYRNHCDPDIKRRKRTIISQRRQLPEVYLKENELYLVFQRCRNPSQFAVHIARILFTPEELRDSNCRGVKDKSPLDRQRLEFIRNSVVKYYNVLPMYEMDVWKQCMQSIDSRCRHERRPKFRNLLASVSCTDDN